MILTVVCSVMDDIDFDDIFDEFEDPHSDQQDFLTWFAEISPVLPLKFIVGDEGDELHQGPKFPPVANLSTLLKKTRENKRVSVWSDGADREIGGVYLPEINGTLCWAVQSESGNKLWLPTLTSAWKYALIKLEQQRIIVENEQSKRHLGALKQQHIELVENNHQQYVLIREKEKEYADKLEKEISLRTAELRKTNEDLIEASRLKSEFLANMSHELRTPMNAIIGFSELLSETELNLEQDDYAKTIRESGAGLLSLINDILDFSKIEANKLDLEENPFMLFDIVNNVKAMFEKPAKKKGIKIVCRLDEKLPREFIGDANRIKQIIVNLVGNSMKFTETGEIVIKVDSQGLQGDRSAVKFSICDTGIGIAQERQNAIFDDFVQEDGTTTRKFGGTGLGLSISSKLVKLMGGDISLESEVGKGSEFSFVLVLSHLPAEVNSGNSVSKAVVQKVEEADKGDEVCVEVKPVVLLVEDNLVNQKLASVLIKRQGCDVVVAGDGCIALEQLKETRFDLIVMDLQMPNMGGLECTKRIREIESGDEKAQYKGLQGLDNPVPIVGLSAHAKKEDMEESLAAGMNDFLTKPIVRAKLDAALTMVKGQR
jgi:signal transduction histidine kinase/CheY-like chemotaxis protein